MKGVSVKGKVAIARYGGSWRGAKPKVACLICSDPHDDGYYRGDPLTPGWASEKGGRKLRREEAATIVKIPVLPISPADAKPLLERLGGPVAPPEWRGALPITYRVGGAAAVVKTDFDWTSKPIYNVAHTRAGPAGARVVQVSTLRPGPLHRIQRQDAAGHSRSSRGWQDG